MLLRPCPRGDASRSKAITLDNRSCWRFVIPVWASLKTWMFSSYSKPQKLAALGWDFLSCSRLSRLITARSTTQLSRATGQRLRFHCPRQIPESEGSRYLQLRHLKRSNACGRASPASLHLFFRHRPLLDSNFFRLTLPFSQF